MYNCLSSADLDRLIAEDLPHGDLTTYTLTTAFGLGACHGGIRLAARHPMQVCGTEEAQMIFARLGATASVQTPSAQAVEAGTSLLAAHGRLESLFAAWKLAQTLIEWSSGVASAVAQLLAVARMVNPAATVACTRKTVPFTRRLAVKAVRAGGGSMHRLNLSDSILLFPEHLQFAGERRPQDVLAGLRNAEPERAIVAEVTTVDEALALAAQVDVLQLEKFSVADVRRVAGHLNAQKRPVPVLAAAGGIHPGNAADYVAAGARVLVTSWPYQAVPRDVQVRFVAGHDLSGNG